MDLQQTEQKIYEEMYSIMTEKSQNNKLLRPFLTRRKIKEILVSIFGIDLNIYKDFIHQTWNQIKEMIHKDIEDQKLSHLIQKISLDEDDINLESLKI